MLDPALIGVWTNVDDTLELSLLKDGRAFVVNTRPGAGGVVGGEPGIWQIQDHKVAFQWLVSGTERETYEVSGEQMTFAGWMHLRRTESEASSTYSQRSAAAGAEARTWQEHYPVGPAIVTAVKDDPHPDRVCAGAKVYAGEGLDVEDLTILTAYSTDPYQVVHEYKTFQATEFVLLPNGRYNHTVVLPKGLDTNLQPTYDTTVTWGQYAVQPGPALEGDAVIFTGDGGGSETVKVLSGRRYMYQPSSDILYRNQHPKPGP